MRILLVNDQLVCGGTEVQVLREKRVLEQHGHAVLLLTFDSVYPDDDRHRRDNGFVNIPLRRSRWSGLLRRLRLIRARPRLKAQIVAEIEAFRPDVIHAHNLYADPLTVYAAIRGHPVVQTLRDYRIVCPLATCVRPNGAVCAGHTHSDCWRVCGSALKKRRRLTRWRRALAARLAAVRHFLSPSAMLAQVCAGNGINAHCVNNPFDFERFGAISKHTDFATKNYVYYGSIVEHKGIFELLDAFEEFQQDRHVRLLIAGDVADGIRERFSERISGLDWVSYLGFLENEAMLRVLSTAHTIVVPSVWMENYPNTVLEGMALGVLVTGSNRGGIPEMLANASDYTFDVYDRNSIIATLTRAYSLSEAEYQRVTEANRALVAERNSLELFYRKIMSALAEAQAAASR